MSNAHELSRQLSLRTREVCELLLPNGVEKDGAWCVGNLTGDAGQSLHIQLDGPKAGLWKDWADNSSKGNLFTLWREVRGLSGPETFAAIEQFLGTATPAPRVSPRIETRAPSETWLRIQATMRPGTEEELDALAELRGLPSTAGLLLATQANTLYFSPVFDDGEDHPSWIITDGARRNAQARRMDGQRWSKGVKAKTIHGCEAKWPIGIHGLNGHDIALVEGGPDFLAAWHCIASSGCAARVQPVAMVGASIDFHPEALPEFRNKHLWIFEHKDEAGGTAIDRWRASANSAGARSIQVVDVGEGNKDLNDLVAAGGQLPTFSPPVTDYDFVEDDLPPNPQAPGSGRPLFTFQLAKDNDASILLGERYLNRGDGAVISSTSGMGKSAIAIQMATELALNRGPFGVQGNGPLRSLIVQSEDSDGDVAEVAYSIRHVLGLSDTQVAEVNSRVHVICDRVNRGHRFILALKKEIDLFKPDLVWINPLQAFIDGDVTDSKDLGSFLREGLNSLNQPARFAYIIIHHTTKPATGKDRSERLWHEVMYDMAGGAEIINWARAIISLRATPTEGEFNLVLAKRGRRAGVTKKVPQGTGWRLEPVTTIPLKHATGRIDVEGIKRGLPIIFWEPRENTHPPAIPDQSRHTGGRPEKYVFKDYRSIFPKKTDPGISYQQAFNACHSNGPIPPGTFRGVLERWEEQMEIEVIRPETGPFRYRSAS